jgi:hypothetical protein
MQPLPEKVIVDVETLGPHHHIPDGTRRSSPQAPSPLGSNR